jgi:hypothetical protein
MQCCDTVFGWRNDMVTIINDNPDYPGDPGSPGSQSVPGVPERNEDTWV